MPICPHCRKNVQLAENHDRQNLVHKQVVGKLKKEVMYFCPHCDCVLGFAHFMGGTIPSSALKPAAFPD
jgi:hypothetical protein